MPMERITLRLQPGIAKLLDDLAERANANHRTTRPHADPNPNTRSAIAREALERGLYEMGVNALKHPSSDTV
jgi:hypothetical protein